MSSDIKIGELPTRLKRNRAIILLAIFLLVVITALVVALYLHPEIKDNPLFVALGFVATVFPCLYLVWQIRESDKPEQGSRKETKAEKVVDPLPGPHTNVTGGVQGDVLSGKFNGPTSSGRDAMDNRGSIGSINKPNGPVNLILGNNITQIIQPQEKPPIPRIHAPPRDFVGRVDKLKEIMGNFNSGATIVGLWGMGGVGKTALALVLAEKLESRFPDGQIFIDLNGLSDNPLNPAEAMSKVILAFSGSGECLPKDQNDLKRLYNSILAGKRVLILLDNAADRKQVEPLLPPKDCVVLITSRKKFSLPGMPDPFLLESLKPSDASDLLLKICPRMSGQAEEIAKLCGYLPLALRAAASLLAVKSDLNPSDYLEELRSERTRLEMIGKEGIDLDVEASFNLSYMRLPAEKASVFRQLSVIPSDFDAEAEEVVCQDEGHRNLSELVTWSLAEFLESGRYRLHDLARVFARSHLEADARENAQQRHAKYYQELLWKANELFLKGGDSLSVGLIQFDNDWTNIQIGQKWAKANTAKSNEVAEICSNFARNNIILRLRLHPRENIKWQEAALVAARQINNRNAEGAHRGNLGLAHADLGDARKAIEYYEQALAIFREIRDYWNEGTVLENLGLAHAALGDTRKAIEFYLKALAIARKIGDKRGEANALGNLGNACADLGDTRKAISYYVGQLAITRLIGDRLGEGIVLGNLGVACAELEDIGKAIECFERHLSIAREIGDRHGEGVALTNLGLAHTRLEDLKNAIEFHLGALAIFSKIGDRPGEVNARGNLGLAYSHLGELRKAIEYYEQALKISRDIGDRRGEGAALSNLGVAYSDLGETGKAIECYEQALKVSHEIGNLRGESAHLGNLGNAYLDLRETRKAIECYEQALKIARKIVDRHSEGNDLGNLGIAYYVLGEPQKAIDYCEQALKIAREISDRRSEGKYLFIMGHLLHRLDRKAEAVKLAKEALIIFEQIESPKAKVVKEQIKMWEK